MRRRWLERLYRARGFALRALGPALRRYRRRYAGQPVVRHAPMPEAAPRPLEGYPDRLWYPHGATATFHLRSPHARNTLVVERSVAPGQFEVVAREAFGRAEQPIPDDASERGCGWTPTLRLAIEEERFSQGHYRARLEAPEASDAESEASAITFLVGPPRPQHRTAVLAPVSTWVAYNPWGGRSLYHNEREEATPYVVSAARPNPALTWALDRHVHAMPVEAHGYRWLADETGADLLPDYALEDPATLAPYRALVLLYHAEYVSPAMRAGLDSLVHGGRSLLALGGNQIYWRIRWHGARAAIECRKDATPFADGTPGGLWRHTENPEEALLGVRFSAPGTGTYAPYRVIDARHPLLAGLGVQDGDLFGERGITPYPACGDETDAPTRLSRLGTQVLARGLNRPEATDDDYTAWDQSAAWNGSAGGTLAFTPLSVRHAVLATGAIHSASALGVDPVFSGVIRNFLDRYGA